jgi:hypothetical protein
MDGSISTHAVINTSHRPSQDRCESEVLSVNRFLAASQYCGFGRIHKLCTYNHVYVIGILYSLRIHRIHAAHLSYTWYFRKRVYPSVSLRMLFMYFRACTVRTQDQSRPVAKGSRHNCLYANIGWTYVCTSSRRPSCSASSNYHFKHFLAKYNLKSVK